jgi:hypothetical protein
VGRRLKRRKRWVMARRRADKSLRIDERAQHERRAALYRR